MPTRDQIAQGPTTFGAALRLSPPDPWWWCLSGNELAAEVQKKIVHLQGEIDGRERRIQVLLGESK